MKDREPRTAPAPELRVCRVGIPLADVEAGRADARDDAFLAAERVRRPGVPLRTLAGRVAARHALNELAGRADRGLDAWEIASEPDGAPRVVRAPDGRPEDWRVSISHSRTTAWALAARIEPEARPS